MAHFVIDLMGDDDVISLPPEKTKEELEKEEAMRKHVLEEIFRRSPQPTLEIVPSAPIRR
jgi:hypothetical protein